MVFSEDGRSLFEVVGGECGVMVSVVELCTGGFIVFRFIDYLGSLVYVFGGIIIYSDVVKVRLLDVNKELFEGYGVVSEEIVIVMVLVVRKKL